MMKTKLKTMIGVLRPNTGKGNRVQPIFSFMRLFALTLLILASQQGWGQQVANEKYEIAEYAGQSGASIQMTGTFPGITSSGNITGQYASSITTNSYGTLNLNNRFAFRPYSSSGHGWQLVSTGLRNNDASKTPDFVICNLKSGDKARVYFTGSMSIKNGTAINSGDFLDSDATGLIHLESKSNSSTISKVEIYYGNNRMYNFAGVVGEATRPGGYSVEGSNKAYLDFDGYGHPDNYRFAVTENGWLVDANGLYYNQTGPYVPLYINDLNINDKVTLNFVEDQTGNNYVYDVYGGSGSTNATNKQYTCTVTSPENFYILIYKNYHISSITIESVALRFLKETDTYDLVTLGYTEPTLIGVPSGATVTYSGNNPQVAIPNSSTGDLMIVNTGDVTITATATLNNMTYTASYILTVKASEAKWAIRNGNECYFPGSNDPTSKENTGKLLVRKVTSVPYMTMEFGEASNSNLSMVTFRNGVRAANQIDENGWQHVWLQNKIDYTMEPYQGTFYIFKPSISGKLTIKGVRNHNGSGANTVVLVDKDATVNADWGTDFSQGKRTRYYVNTIDAQGNSSDGDKYYSYVIVKTLTFANNDTYAVTEEQIDLTGGHTYYLYANTPNTNGVRTINIQSNTDQTIGNGSNDWQAFYLSGFKFETPNFKFPYQNVVMGATAGTLSDVYHRETLASSYRQYVGTGTETNIVYSRICKGDISCSINSSTGELSGINGHGAIVVTASMMDGETKLATTSYVLTVPYTTITSGGRHTWKFNVKDYGTEGAANMMEQIDALKSNAPAKEWSIQYKVRRYDSGTDALNYINVPVLANALEVRGDNARYISSTAGLLINANANTFGTTTTVKDTEYKTEILGDGIGRVYKMVNSEWVEQTSSADIDIALKTLMNYNASDAVDPCNYLTLENGSSFTIPNLKEGQHIRIKWSRYSPNHGDLISVTNLNDLNGTSITDAFTIGAGGNVNLNGGTGCHEFIVAANGDVTFTVSQDGWVNIYQIDVDDPFIETELTLKTTSTWEEVENPNGTTEWKERGWTDAPLTYIRKATGGDAITEKYTENFGGTLSQSNSAITYSIEGTPSGSLNGHCSIGNYTEHGITFTNGELDITSGGHGRFTLVQEGKVDGKYVLDRKKYTIKVYEYDYTTQTYPHTWNMKHVTTQTGNATVSNLTTDAGLTNNTTSHQYKHWTASNDNKDFTLNVGNPENLMAWNYKTTIGGTETAIPELDGLGIIPQDLTDNTDNSIVFKAGTRGTEPNLEYGAGLQLGDKDNTIVVPSVATGQTVYVAATDNGSGSISTTVGGSPLTATTIGGNKIYVISGSGSDVNLVVKNMTINQIAVSKDTKTVTAAGYATEARDYPLDFTLDEIFLGRNQIAYMITGVQDNMVIATHVEYVPRVPKNQKSALGYGVMVSGNQGTETYWPLFTTDVDQPLQDLTQNKLVGVLEVPDDNVEQTTLINGTTYYNYILTNGGYNVTMDNGTPKVGTPVSGLGYYLVFATGTILDDGVTTYSAQKPYPNSAYLQLPTALAVHQSLNSGGSARAVFFIDFDGEATDIQMPMVGVTDMENDVYYTLQGVRVDKPGKGLYIRNGRKVYVK